MPTKVKDAETAKESGVNLPFEEAVQRLEKIVETMEHNDLPLETLLSKYEEATLLARACQSRLQEAELKIQALEKNGNGEFNLKSTAPIQEPA